MFVALAWDYYRDHLLDIFKLWQGGLVFYGGLVLGIVVSIVFLRLRRMPVWETGDIIAPGLALGQAVGRIGCLAAGCCYGEPTTLPWAVTFTHPACLAPLDQPLHPTQAYSSLSLFAIFGLLSC